MCTIYIDGGYVYAIYARYGDNIYYMDDDIYIYIYMYAIYREM